MLFEDATFTLYFDASYHAWELHSKRSEALEEDALELISAWIERHDLDAPLIIWREGDSSLSFEALRALERLATRLPALVAISRDLATRRALEVTFDVLLKHPCSRVFACEPQARDWLLRQQRSRPLSLAPTERERYDSAI